jgi:3-oxoacyl-(acyl-carrier-protein) synthase
MYIRATGNISPQKSFGHPPLLAAPVANSGNRLACIEPDYKEFIDVKLIRRMSRIIRMGVAAAIECLKEANLSVPDAIITGTAYGCLEDTGSFLGKMVENNEELLTPTAFIQSTHNTIGAQIGLILQCNRYNNAFVHRGFSFESALLDGMMLLKEGEASNVLVGAIDEITHISHTILSRMGLYRHGTVAGEGASFFLLANDPSSTDYAKLDGLKTFYKPNDQKEIENSILSFLKDHSVELTDIDLVITGRNGDAGSDKIFDELDKTIFYNCDTAGYKDLCGEYPTAAAFALWLAANIIKTGTIPVALQKESSGKKIRKILIYNYYLNIHHSLLLVSAC